MALTVKDVLTQLEAMGDDKVWKLHRKNGAGDNMFGVKMGDIRKLAGKIKSDELAMPLWDSGNLDAKLLALLLFKPKKLSPTELERMVKAIDIPQVADWMNSYIVKNHPDKETLRQKWMQAKHRWLARSGWSLTSERVSKDPEGLDIPALLDRIEAEMGSAPAEVQWTMNSTLASIGIHFAKHRKRAIAIGEKLGLYRDYPVAKGCTSPFAPIWINEMVRRQA